MVGSCCSIFCFLYSVLWIIIWPSFVLFILAIVLSVLLITPLIFSNFSYFNSDTNSHLSSRVCDSNEFSPRKVSRFAPFNRYYIIIDEVFFDNFLVFIYQLYAKKIIIHSFWSTLFIYCIQKIIIHSFWFTLSKISSETFLAKFTKNHTWTVKSQKVVFFVPTQKCANNLSPSTYNVYCSKKFYTFNQVSNKEWILNVKKAC